MRPLPCTLALSLFAVSTVANAQQFELPRPSPVARVMQTVGLTEITVDYSSPAVKGRKIWGGLLPYGEAWRAGANGTTKITFSKDVTVGNTPLPAGTYGLFVIPNKTSFTFALSKPTTPPLGYKKDDDFVRVDARPQAVPLRERLIYTFSDFADQNRVNLDLEWEKVRISLPIKLATSEQVEANIKNGQDNAWSAYNQAARYELEQAKNVNEGLALVDKSLAMKETWFNTWTKAQLEAAKGDYKQARALAVKADELGGKGPADAYFFKAEVQKAIGEWKAK
jgi:hypothetical protein